MNYNQKINQALDEMMIDEKVYLLGLGVSDPKRFFDTTKNLIEKYGLERVRECPTSENTYLGMALGMSLCGLKPIVHFQRVDFMLYAFDQLINNIAKWNDMFGRETEINLVIRTLVGMGWGQGAQHSQNLTSVLAHFPGLIITAPSSPSSAYKLLKNSINYGKPVVQIEHRWLQYLNEKDLDNDDYIIGKAKIRKEGNQLTIITWSYGVAEALRFAEIAKNFDIEIVDLLTINPIDSESIIKSAKKTGRVIIWEPGWQFIGLGAEIFSQIIESNLKVEILRIGYSHTNASSSPWKINETYPHIQKIASLISQKFEIKVDIFPEDLKRWPHDQDQSQWTPWA